MKEALTNYNLLFVMGVIACVTAILKCICATMYRNLMKELSQMGKTNNQWMKAMIHKYEAYYQLKRSVHNIDNFVDKYLYEFRYHGLSLETWNYAGIYGGITIISADILGSLFAVYYHLEGKWYIVAAITTISLLLCLGLFEVILGNHRQQELFRAQLIDYLENNLRTRLENDCLSEEERHEYLMEYFEEPQKKVEERETVKEKTELYSADSMLNPDMRELMETLLKEAEVDKQIAGKQEEMIQSAAVEEKAKIFDEVLQEYI